MMRTGHGCRRRGAAGLEGSSSIGAVFIVAFPDPKLSFSEAYRNCPILTSGSILGGYFLTTEVMDWMTTEAILKASPRSLM
jgi:hypothetical protein